MIDTDTPADAENDTSSSIGELLARRHQTQPAHEPHREVGEVSDEDDDDDDAGSGDATPPATGAQAATTPETKTAPAGEAGAAQPSAGADAPAAPVGPKWYREEMAKKEAELRTLRQQLATGRQPAPQPRPEPQQPELPNPAEDPVGYANALIARQQEAFSHFQLKTTLDLSARFLKQTHGAEAFDETMAWLTTRPDLEAHFTTQPDPWGSAYAYYQREKIADEIGDDPSAYRKRIEEEAIARYKASQEAGGTQAAAPSAPPRMRAPPPPAPASTVRSAAQPRDGQGKFTGPAPLKLRNNF